MSKQFRPSPENPAGHSQEYDPIELLQTAEREDTLDKQLMFPTAACLQDSNGSWVLRREASGAQQL